MTQKPQRMKKAGFILFLLLIIDNSAQGREYTFPDTFSMDEITQSSPVDEMPKIWSFQDCIDWAIANNIDIRRTMLSILESDESISQAKDAYLPSFNFSTSHSMGNYPFPQAGQNSTSYNSSYSLNGSWTIWEGNIRKYRLESSKLIKEQQRLAGEDVVKNLELGILQAYLNIMYAAEAVEIAKQSLEVSTAQAVRAKRLMENGKTSKVDYMQFESQKAQDEYTLTQAKNSYLSSKVTLKNILNLGLDYDLEIQEINFDNSSVTSPLPAKTTVFNLAAAWLPQFRSNELNKSIYEYNLKIAKAGYLPSVAMSAGIGTGYNSGNYGGWGSQMKNFLNDNVGISLSIPIWDGNSTKRQIAIAKLQALQYDLNKTDLYNELSQTIENLFIESENARARYSTGLAQLEATTLTSQLTDRQFELGYVNPLELLTAHNNLLNARLELLQSKFMAILANKTIDYYTTTSVSLP